MPETDMSTFYVRRSGRGRAGCVAEKMDVVERTAARGDVVNHVMESPVATEAIVNPAEQAAGNAATGDPANPEGRAVF